MKEENKKETQKKATNTNKSNNKQTTQKKTNNNKQNTKKQTNANKSTGKQTNKNQANNKNKSTNKQQQTKKEVNNKQSTKKETTTKQNTNTKKETNTKQETNKKVSQNKQNAKKESKKKKKDKKPNKFVEIIKKKWLVQGTSTAILVAAIISVFAAVSIVLHSMDQLTPIDLSQEKLYTLSDESKEKVKDIDQEVDIYFMDSTEDDTNYDLARKFTAENQLIKVELIKSSERADLVAKFNVQAGAQQIIVSSGNRFKILSPYDLVHYDLMGQATSIADQKLTSAITYVTAAEVPKAYFLEGYSEFSSDNMQSFLSLVSDEALVDIQSLNIISTGKIPDDCSALVITTPSKDFDETATNAIMEYINAGGKIMWLNGLYAEDVNYPNVNKILAEFAINPFEKGRVLEGDPSKMASAQPFLIMPTINSSEVTEDISGAGKMLLLLNPTKINQAADEVFTEKKVTVTPIMQTSDKAFYKADASQSDMTKTQNDQTGPFDLGLYLEKTIVEENKETETPAVKSKMILVGENYFVSDIAMSAQTPVPLVYYANNADFVGTAFKGLLEREETVVQEKSTGTVTYTPTDLQNTIILITIFAVPILIIIIGIVVWIVRRRKK